MPDKTLIAHIRNCSSGSPEVQTISDHCRNAAKYAEDCLKSVSLKETAGLAALVHDLGKARREFQEYITGSGKQKRGSVIHTFQGCRFFIERFHDSDDAYRRLTAEILAFVVGAHHGLFDIVDSDSRNGFLLRQQREDIGFEEAVNNYYETVADQREVKDRFEAASREVSEWIDKLDKLLPPEEQTDDSDFSFMIGFTVRLILSSVIEGDRRDTALFMNQSAFSEYPENMNDIWKERLLFAEEKLSKFPQNTNINRARTAISDQCREFAKKRTGIYRLNVPTGSGKTLSSLRYALAHAAVWNKQHIIFVSPLLSILEQNAEIIRRFVGDERMILEHHSNLVHVDREREELQRMELLTETWDAPIIITTLVQLLNTLFAGETSSIRRLHSLVDSIIVIDEVQTVPLRMLTLFNMAIRFLSGVCRTTIILCSATQPALELAKHPLGTVPEEIVPYDKKIWNAFERTRIEFLGTYRKDELPELLHSILKKKSSLLVVCNKKDEAAELFTEMKSKNHDCYHLSAAMCVQHRRRTLENLRESLKSGRQTICISTQVIEAGVDISFSCVIRFAAGMDNIIQAAGRCNRNGETEVIQPVFIVNCSDENLIKLTDIQMAKNATIDLLYRFNNSSEEFNNDLASKEAINYYYLSLYREMNGDAQDYPIKKRRTTLFDLLSGNNKYITPADQKTDAYFLRQAFKEAGELFQVFDEESMTVIVPYSSEGKELVSELRGMQALADMGYRKELLEKAKNYAVSLYEYQVKKLEKERGIQYLFDRTVGILDDVYYDDETGIVSEPHHFSFLEV